MSLSITFANFAYLCLLGASSGPGKLPGVLGPSPVAGASHNTAHNYTFQSTSTVTIAREAEGGGFVVWLSELDGPNLINNFELGRQISMDVRDTCDPILLYDPNPTQGGSSNVPAGSEIFYVHSDYMFSKSIPMLFDNPIQFPCSQTPPPGTQVLTQRIRMWNEFLPNSNGRAVLVRYYWTSTDPYQGKSHGQEVMPNASYNFSLFDHAEFYSGNQPWTGQPISTHSLLGCPHGVPEPCIIKDSFSMTELWSAVVDSNGFGVSRLAESGVFEPTAWDLLDMGSGDHQNDVMTLNPTDRFCMRIDPGETQQTRESKSIFYVGDVDDARTFFSTYRPVTGGSYFTDFNTGSLRDWNLNSNPIAISGGQVVMGPDNSWVNEMALVDRYWADATYEVEIKRSQGTTWYGIVFRKQGQQHFWTVPSGYYMVYFSGVQGSMAIKLYDPVGLEAASTDLPVDFDPTESHDLRVVTVGYQIQVYVDDELKITWTDNDPNKRYSAGYFALMSDSGSADTGNVVHFDNLSITASGDSTAPASVTGVTAVQTGFANQIVLNWSNPTSADWRWTRVVRKTGSTPAHPRDGYPVYEGKLANYVDADAPNGTTYVYAVYTVDHAGNYSPPVVVSATPCSAVPTGDFSADVTQGLAPLTVQFTSTASPDTTGFSWNFGDGGVSSLPNPSHVYTNAGQYDVTLTLSNCAGSTPISKLDYITSELQLIFDSIAAEDGWVLESGEDTSVGLSFNATQNTVEGLRAGDDPQDRQALSIVSFNTASLPDTATVTSSVLRLVRGTAVNTPPFQWAGAPACVADIKNGTFGTAGLQSTDFQAAASLALVVTLSNPTSNGEISTGSLVSGGLTHVNKTGKTQFRVYYTLDDNDDFGADYLGFYPGETTAANRPKLFVRYVP